MNLLRAVGISIVVLRHSFAPFTNSWDIAKFYHYNIFADEIGQYISTVSMPLFVFISGYLYSFLRSTLGKYPTYQNLVKKKFKRLLIPYLFFAPIYIYFFIEFDSLKSFITPLWTGSGHLWFLLMMFIMFISFYKFEHFFCTRIKTGLVIAVILYGLVLPMHYLGLVPIAHVFKYFVYFYLGILVFLNSEQVSRFLKGKVALIFCAHLISYLLFFFLMKQTNDIYILSAIDQDLLPLGIMSLAYMYGFLNYIYEKQLKILDRSKPILSHINYHSYYIYIFHQPILQILFGLVFMQHLPIYIAIIFAFITAMLLSLSISFLLMKTKFGRTLISY